MKCQTTTTKTKRHYKMENFKFNQNGVITSIEKLDILDIMGTVFSNNYNWMVLQNELYGLFDGCYYAGIEQRVFNSEFLSDKDKLAIIAILLKVRPELQPA